MRDFARRLDHAVKDADAFAIGVKGKEFLALSDHSTGTFLPIVNAERASCVNARDPSLAHGRGPRMTIALSGRPRRLTTASIQSAVNLESQPRKQPQLRQFSEARCIALPSPMMATLKPQRQKSCSELHRQASERIVSWHSDGRCSIIGALGRCLVGKQIKLPRGLVFRAVLT